MAIQPEREHQWLQKLVGAWEFDNECVMGPDQPPMKSGGSEVVRSLGGLWTVGEGTGGDTPDGEPMASIMTLGYDPAKSRFVGTFVASCMTYLWVYDGFLEGNRLTLEVEGPAFSGEGMAKYRDCIEFLDDDHRVLTSELQAEDGSWVRFMTANYRRKS